MAYPWSAGNTLTAADLNAAFAGYTVNTQTGTTYTFVLTDRGKLVTASNASASTYTIPLNSGVAYATGTWIDVLNLGAGTVTLSPTGGVTLNGTTTIPQNGRVRLTKTGTDTWYSSAMMDSGLTWKAVGSGSNAATVSINNCFVGSEDFFRVIMTGFVHTGTATLQMRLRASAADKTDAAYTYTSMQRVGAVNGGFDGAAQTSFLLGGGYAASNTFFHSFDVLWPTAAGSGTWITGVSTGAGTSFLNGNLGGIYATAAAIDGMTFYASSGNVTINSVRVYGYKN